MDMTSPDEGDGMARVTVDISMSLDGYVAGPNQTLEDPLGRGGMRLHEWVFGLDAWKQAHGLGAGDRNADNEIVEEGLQATGAVIMGRRMWSGGAGPWADDPNADGWWGDEFPFRVPVFVLTHHPRETEVKDGTTVTFVRDGIESALEQASAVAGGKNVALAGGASVVQQFLRAGLVDELQVHVAPLLLGDGGVRLFDELGAGPVALECTRAIASPGITHLRYRVEKGAAS
jgi:dihydrofolate reductase